MTTKVLVTRKWFTPKSTIGEITIDGQPFGFTLEDDQRAGGVKVQNQTAIPLGTYKLTVDWSNHFQRYALHILDVPMFQGIRIHSGNTDIDTDGCILVGRERGPDCLLSSRLAFNAIWERLTEPDGLDQQHNMPAFKMKAPTTVEIVDAQTDAVSV
ncbi:MAG TPA: DUF5675 family protein [Candidatus Angelobacter sp.]|jgi:hypothetical protein|nr:DUF5675 family protein [Candidatus Angelobacter sp.]